MRKSYKDRLWEKALTCHKVAAKLRKEGREDLADKLEKRGDHFYEEVWRLEGTA